MPRDYAYDILPEIKARYAVKTYLDEPIGREALLPLIEAARYAPSCYNEQPWRYILGDNVETHEKLASCLVPGNAWAKKAPVLLLVLYKKTFDYDGKQNPWAAFDTGCATGFLQLEAVNRGYAVHCMAGFDAKLAKELFRVPDDFGIITLIALGKPALDDEAEPGTREPLTSFLFEA